MSLPFFLSMILLGFTLTDAYTCNSTTPYPGWKDFSDKLFRAPISNYEDPILEGDSLYDNPCDISFYKEFSPVFLMSEPLADPKDLQQNFKNVLDRVSVITQFQAWVRDPNATSTDPQVVKLYNEWQKISSPSEFPKGRFMERKICYSEGHELLECSAKGKCVCAISGTFAKMKFSKGQHIYPTNESLVPNSVACISAYCGYCVKNSLTCDHGGRCFSYGNRRGWPFNCVFGVCREVEEIKGGDGSFSFEITLSRQTSGSTEAFEFCRNRIYFLMWLLLKFLF